MASVEALVLVAAALLVAAGVGKLRSPTPTARALAEAGLPASPVLVRLLGAVEIGVGGAALLLGGWVAASVLALAYAVVTAVAVRQWRAGTDCGCFGAPAAPGATVTGLHVAVDAGAAGIAVGAAVLDAPGLWALLPAAPWGGLPTLAALLLATALLRTALVRLPDLWAAQALHAQEAR